MLGSGTFLSVSPSLAPRVVASLDLVQNEAVDQAYRILAILFFGCTFSGNSHIVVKRRCDPRALLSHNHLLSLHLITAHLDADELKRLESRRRLFHIRESCLIFESAHLEFRLMRRNGHTGVLGSSWFEFILGIQVNFFVIREHQLILIPFRITIILEKYLLTRQFSCLNPIYMTFNTALTIVSLAVLGKFLKLDVPNLDLAPVVVVFGPGFITSTVAIDSLGLLIKEMVHVLNINRQPFLQLFIIFCTFGVFTIKIRANTFLDLLSVFSLSSLCLWASWLGRI